MMYCLRKKRYLAKNPRWPMVFKMVDSSNIEQVNISIRIFHLVIQTQNLEQMMFRKYFIRNMRYLAEHPRWPLAFKMAAIA